MRFARLLLLIGVVALAACLARPAQAGSVPVGSSTLIGTLDYSDTYTVTDSGGLQDRPIGAYGLAGIDYPTNGTAGEGQWVENCYGNTPRMWTDGFWSVQVDTSILVDASSPYPGNSGGGSATGVTQCGYWRDWGIEYGVRDRYVVQFDSVQCWDRIDIGTGFARDTIGAGNFTIFFRPGNGTSTPQISLYHPLHGEYDTGFASPTTAYAWHNYAALFDITARTIEVFVDENSLGVIDIDTIGGGVLAAEPFVNDAVNVGVCHSAAEGGWLNWSDNFQVGAPVPEPCLVGLWLSAIATLAMVRRRR